MPEPYTIDYRLRALVLLLLIPTLCFLTRHYHLDDALIYARYVQHALEGKGLVFNTGEPVNALTSILDTWILLGLATLLHGHILVLELITGGIFLLGASLLAEATVPFAGIFFATSSLCYLCTGLETSLFLLLLILTVRAYVAERYNWLPLLCMLTILARFEGGAMAIVIAWQLWRRRQRLSLASFLAPVLLIAVYFAFNVHFYQRILPQSATAKFGQGLSGYWGRWPTAFLNIPDFVYAPLSNSWLLAVLLATLAWFGSRHPRMARWNQIVLPFLLFLFAFYLLFNIPGYHWYYAPFLFFFVIYAACLLPRTRPAYAAASLIALCFVAGSALYLHRASLKATGWIAYAEAAQWINQNTPANATVATVETGTIGWYCHRDVLDIVGLTTPQNARYTAHRDFRSWLQERPDYIIVHPANPFPWERVALASPDYTLVPTHFGDVSLLHRKSDSPH